MTKRGFWAGLLAAFIPERGQQQKDRTCAPLVPALNARCPIWGMMAEPSNADMGSCAYYDSAKLQGFAVGVPGFDGTVSIARCERCNAAFFQNAQ